MKDSSSVDHHHHIPSPITPKQKDDPYPIPTHQAQAQARQVMRPKKEKVVVNVIAYKECLKNHAAALGDDATDGCGEFIPSADGGGPHDPLRCSACGCHRNFHRKEVLDDGGGALGTSPYLPQCHYLGSTTTSTTPISGLLRARWGPHNLPIGVGPTSIPQDGDMMEENGGEGNGRVSEVKKKRHRTKFSKEQKEKMVEFARKTGWKIHKLEEGLVQEFCQEVGIKRRVLKVWMHNNKHHFVKPININDNNNNLSPPNDTISHSNSSDR